MVRRSGRLAKKPSVVLVERDSSEEEEEHDSSEVAASKTKKTTRKRRKESDDEDDYGSGSESNEEDDEEEEEEDGYGSSDEYYAKQWKKTTKAASVAKKRKAKALGSNFLDKDTLERLEAAADKYAALSIPELKELLRKNSQRLGGTKGELVDRVAQCSVLGNIPHCPSCGGGKPVFDIADGSYFCKGYFDDTEFVRCSQAFSFAEVARYTFTD